MSASRQLLSTDTMNHQLLRNGRAPAASIRERLLEVTAAERARYEAIIDQFEAAWEDHPESPPEIAAYLPAEQPLRALVLVALLESDMESRRRRSPASLFDDPVRRFPELADDPAAAAEVLAWQYELVPPPPTEADPASAGRNALGEEIGQGGIAVVLRGFDPRLNRELAVKILKKEHRSNLALVQRFQVEAQVLARLQHPGVVPVYDFGHLADGRPWFTMRRVHGPTLGALLDARPEPSHDLPRLLGLFEQVCQTLAYAHEQGVIHRDLKPANVMVGTFGEVLVMDWGFAKVLQRESPPPEAPSEEEAHQTPWAVKLTWVGMVVGTPAYMAPEQAGGEVDLLDERCDVFGLGAMLCEVLTGKPPYLGCNTEEAMRRARVGDLGDALSRLDSCGADGELVQLCKACLAPRCEDRPASARVVADRLAAYQARVQERLRQVELEQAAAARGESAFGSGIRTSLPPSTAGKPPQRRLAWIAAAALVVVAVGSLVAVLGKRNDHPDEGLQQNPGPAAALEVLEFDVKHYSNVKGQDGEGRDRLEGILGEESFGTRVGDSVEVAVQLSQPAYAYLIAFGTDGKDEVCSPDDKADRPVKSDRLRYPPATKPGVNYGLDEGTGLQAFAVVASRRPLPSYKEWRSRRGALAWSQHTPPEGTVWEDMGDGPLAFTSEHPRRAKDRSVAGKTPLAELTAWLRQDAEVDTVAAIAFAVLPAKTKR
jgi:serine/threonine protein kinase